MPQIPLPFPAPLPPALQSTPDATAVPVIVLVLDAQQRPLSWRQLTLAEAAAMIAMQSPQDFCPLND